MRPKSMLDVCSVNSPLTDTFKRTGKARCARAPWAHRRDSASADSMNLRLPAHPIVGMSRSKLIIWFGWSGYYGRDTAILRYCRSAAVGTSAYATAHKTREG